MFLLPWLGGPNLCRVTDPAFDFPLFQEIYEPLHRSRGFDTHSHRAWKRGIKLPHVVAFVLESHLPYLSRCGVQHRQRLLASVQITSYNSHLGLLRSEHCRANTEQSTRAVARPASLRHHSGVGTCETTAEPVRHPWTRRASVGQIQPSNPFCE